MVLGMQPDKGTLVHVQPAVQEIRVGVCAHASTARQEHNDKSRISNSSRVSGFAFDKCAQERKARRCGHSDSGVFQVGRLNQQSATATAANLNLKIGPTVPVYTFIRRTDTFSQLTVCNQGEQTEAQEGKEPGGAIAPAEASRGTRVQPGSIQPRWPSPADVAQGGFEKHNSL